MLSIMAQKAAHLETNLVLFSCAKIRVCLSLGKYTIAKNRSEIEAVALCLVARRNSGFSPEI